MMWVPAPKTIDSLSPFQVPRRSGIALSAAEGAAASAASMTIQANLDMGGLLLWEMLDLRLAGTRRAETGTGGTGTW